MTEPPSASGEAALEAAGLRDAATLQVAGEREANVLQTAGVRDEATLATAGEREAAALTQRGRRKINLIWETTQAAIAISVVLTTLGIAALLVIRGDKGSADSAFLFLSSANSLIIGFYFGRTNHQRIGGVGGNDAGR